MNSGTHNHSKAKSSVSTTKTVRKPNIVTHKKPMWKPTGRHFTLYASSPLTRILKPIDEPVELTPSVSSNHNLAIESSPSSLAVIQQLRCLNCPPYCDNQSAIALSCNSALPRERFETLLPLLGVVQIVIWSQGHTVADSNAETFKDQAYFILNFTRNHSKAKSSVSTTKTVRKPNVVTPKKPMWKPTGRHFTLYASSPLTRILEPIDEPVKVTPSVSSNTKKKLV
uniref:Uncharacterized protein n=1 Tax=Tanacetum cinerariifolium TaxID=118510 RepID=A0A6L2P1K9_TANCI|nr:hypothetical protein [Tanacetum cinerariifolium]